ncbi:PGC-1 and ERR-induced regulator in muscle protein 1 [Empidonax traillii]|uniref:PGC-1 and ERR-induced regulator in muscle protein 1 n=1 Tax=Empidonax traillii TaxID=164674 RepID=UPI000FFD5D11|nr:PGC-1 and ERR-induced regulator in muscle protein 1 [Empidonax traillii]
MDNFEYSIQLNDREWAEFFLASEECNLAPASLATAEEQCLSDIEQGDGHASPDRLIPAREGSEPAPGTGSSAPRGVPGDTPLRWQAGGHLAPAELLSGSEDEAELGSVGRFLCESNEPGCPAPPAMPSAGGTAQGNPGQDAAGEAAASEKGAAGGSRAMEPPSTPSTPQQAGDAAGGQPHGGSPAPPARKRHPSASHSEPRPRGPPCDAPIPSLGAAQEEASGERAGPEQSSPAGSPSVVRPKVPGQQKKSRKQQRGAGAAEGDPGGAAAQGATQGPGKAPPSSPVSSRKSKGKEKAAKAALVRLGSEEAAEAKQPVPGSGVDEGDPAGSAPPRQKGKEPGAQSPGKTKATKPSKAGQAGGLGLRDSAPAIPDNGAVAPSGEMCQEMPGKPLQAKNVAAFGGDAAEGTCGDPAAEPPRKLSPPCFADGASARSNTLDVTWPEMYDYLFCDSQEEEEELGSSVEGRRSPLQREISWPELYEYFFNEPEGKRKKAKGKERKRKKFGSLDHTGLQNEDPSSAPVRDTVIISVPEVCEHLFPERPRNRTGWRGIFSIAPASEVKRAVGALKSFLQRQRHPARGEAPASQALVPRGSGEKFALVPLAPPGRGQVWLEGEDMALALTGTAEDPRVLTHKDMCLVFCAFASWAVKTSDLQAPDAWKTMFLASFGTLSAIRYFRRQVREGHPRT